jgi:hypothetical protein
VRWSWERWAGVAGIAFVVLYVVAFAIGAEPGDSDREILDHYADSGERAKEFVAFFLISAAALGFVLLASGLRNLLARVDPPPRTLASLAWTGGVACAVLVLAGNAVSRATAFAATDDLLKLDPNTQRIFETAGFLLYVAAAYAAILLVVAVSLAALRYGVLPRWLAWSGFVAAVLLLTAIAFVGFLVLLAWVLAISITLLARATPAETPPGGRSPART